jgi:heavy metal sensor kinase
MLCLPLVAFAVVSYLTFSRTLTSRTDGFLNDALTVFGNELLVERRQIPAPEEAIRTTVREVRFQDLEIVVLSEEGGVVASSPRGPDRVSPLPPIIIEALRAGGGREGAWISTVAGPGGEYRVRTHSLRLEDQRFRVAGIYPLAEVAGTLRRIRHLFLVAIPLLLLLAGTGGWFLARRSFRPISSVAARAAEISATTLYERLPVVADDELGALTRVLNDLLDRLEQSFEQQRRFVADASHELRSPAAILRTETDITLSREHRTEAEYRESLNIIRDAARRLTGVVDDLFLLARVDGGHPVMSPASLYLDEVVRDTARIAGPLAERKGVQVEVSGLVEAPFRGDSGLLGRLLLNLLDNAIKHSPEGGVVQVRMEERGGAIEIGVVDRGAGIPEEVQSRIFERFFQVDSARTRNGRTLTSGAGLGLAIGRRIAEMHGGRLDLASSRPGRTEFLLTLPASVSASKTPQESPMVTG